MLRSKDKQILIDIGVRIRKLRLRKDITQAQMAFELHTSTRHYQRIENGEINTSLLKLIKIANILDEPIEQIIK